MSANWMGDPEKLASENLLREKGVWCVRTREEEENARKKTHEWRFRKRHSCIFAITSWIHEQYKNTRESHHPHISALTQWIRNKIGNIRESDS